MADLITKLIPLLVAIESGGDTYAIGDNGRSVGILQIQEIVVDDVNRIQNVYKFKYEDRKDPALSKLICTFYLHYWGKKYKLETGKQPTLEVLARIYNGGPNGWKKKSTNKYWDKVKDLINKQKEEKDESKN